MALSPPGTACGAGPLEPSAAPCNLNPAMMIEQDSVHFRILERMCSMPKAVRGISSAMLERHFHADWAIEELAAAGLISERGWANGPGMIWVPTASGEALYRELARRAGDDAAGAAT